MAVPGLAAWFLLVGTMDGLGMHDFSLHTLHWGVLVVVMVL